MIIEQLFPDPVLKFMAARRISYISFLVLIATLATASNADGLSYCNSQHLLEHCIGTIAGRCVSKKSHNKKTPEAPQSFIAGNLGIINEWASQAFYTRHYPDIRSEIVDKSRILRE